MRLFLFEVTLRVGSLDAVIALQVASRISMKI